MHVLGCGLSWAWIDMGMTGVMGKGIRCKNMGWELEGLFTGLAEE